MRNIRARKCRGMQALICVLLGTRRQKCRSHAAVGCACDRCCCRQAENLKATATNTLVLTLSAHCTAADISYLNTAFFSLGHLQPHSSLPKSALTFSRYGVDYTGAFCMSGRKTYVFAQKQRFSYAIPRSEVSSSFKRVRAKTDFVCSRGPTKHVRGFLFVLNAKCHQNFLQWVQSGYTVSCAQRVHSGVGPCWKMEAR